jgi:hypothetical protein
MSNVNMPGFSAGNSLYTPSGHYRATVGISTALPSAAVTPSDTPQGGLVDCSNPIDLSFCWECRIDHPVGPFVVSCCNARNPDNCTVINRTGSEAAPRSGNPGSPTGGLGPPATTGKGTFTSAVRTQ